MRFVPIGRYRSRLSANVLLNALDRLGVWAALILLCAISAGLSPYFLTLNNLLNIFNQASVAGVTAVGVTLVMITGGVDLSVGSTISMSAAVAAVVMSGRDSRVLPAIALCLALGAVIGAINGILVSARGVNSFILTLGMAGAVQGATLIYTGGTAAGAVGPTFAAVMSEPTAVGIPSVDIIFAAVIALGLFIEKRTAFGQRLFLVGSNTRAADLSGIEVNRVQTTAYILSGVCAAAAGLVLLGRVGVSSVYAGQGYDFTALTAVVLGGTTFEGGRGGIVGTVGGILILTIAFNLVALLGLNFNTQLIVQGAILIVAGGLYRLLQRRA